MSKLILKVSKEKEKILDVLDRLKLLDHEITLNANLSGLLNLTKKKTVMKFNHRFQ